MLQGTADVATKSEYLKELLDKALGTLGLLKEPPAYHQPPLQQSEKGISSVVLRRRGAPAPLKDAASTNVCGVTYLEIPGGFHDLLHDTQTPICLSNIKVWLNEIVGH